MKAIIENTNNLWEKPQINNENKEAVELTEEWEK